MRANQINNAMDREEEYLSEQLSSGMLSVAEYNRQMLELQRDMRAAYEEDCFDAMTAVQNEWGW